MEVIFPVMDIPRAADRPAFVGGRFVCPTCGEEYDALPYEDVPCLVRLYDPNDTGDPRIILGFGYADDMDCMTFGCHGRLRRGE
jgi:hypothetical protein